MSAAVPDVTERVATKLYAFYAGLPEDEQLVMADLLRTVTSHGDVAGYGAMAPLTPAAQHDVRAVADKTQDLIAARVNRANSDASVS